MSDVTIEPAAQQAQSPQTWSVPHCVLFRFICCYWLLYALPVEGHVNILRPFLRAIPAVRSGLRSYVQHRHMVILWTGVHVLGIPGAAANFLRGSETILDYIDNLLILVVSLAAALIWSLLDRRRTGYPVLHDWVRLLVRYMLAFSLFSYGFQKVFPTQFTPPSLVQLMEPFGEFSPSGALWKFMGASMPYTIFGGAAEVAGGLLLLFRRTTTLGAMVSFAVTLNVAILNYSYDVGVKLYSMNLVLMACFLLAPDLPRLANVLVLKRAVAPADLGGPRFNRRWARIAAYSFCVLFVGYYLVDTVTGAWEQYKRYAGQPHSPIFGLYRVESGAPSGWQKVAIEDPNRMAVRMIDDSVQWFPTEYDTAKNAVMLNKKVEFATLAWSRPDPSHLTLTGTFEGAPVSMRLRRIDTELLLLNRGFHWISDEAFWNQ